MSRSIEEQKLDAINMMVASNIMSSGWTETVKCLYTIPNNKFPNIFYNKLRDKIKADEAFLKYIGHTYSKENEDVYEAICQFSEAMLKVSRLNVESQTEVYELIERLYENRERN